jgi:hypothetical protein
VRQKDDFRQSVSLLGLCIGSIRLGLEHFFVLRFQGLLSVMQLDQMGQPQATGLSGQSADLLVIQAKEQPASFVRQQSGRDGIPHHFHHLPDEIPFEFLHRLPQALGLRSVPGKDVARLVSREAHAEFGQLPTCVSQQYAVHS